MRILRRPLREVVVLRARFGQVRSRTVGHGINHQVLILLVDDALAVGRPAREAVVRPIVGDHAQVRAVRLHDRHLRGGVACRPKIPADGKRDQIAGGDQDEEKALKPGRANACRRWEPSGFMTSIAVSATLVPSEVAL
jgi:hypothetical protein